MRDDDRARWTKLVADFESADLSQREFAQERDLPISNLRYWIYRLRKESRPLVTDAAERSDQVPEQVTVGEGSRLVPVRVVASAPWKMSDAAVIHCTSPGPMAPGWPLLSRCATAPSHA